MYLSASLIWPTVSSAASRRANCTAHSVGTIAKVSFIPQLEPLSDIAIHRDTLHALITNRLSLGTNDDCKLSAPLGLVMMAAQAQFTAVKVGLMVTVFLLHAGHVTLEEASRALTSSTPNPRENHTSPPQVLAHVESAHTSPVEHVYFPWTLEGQLVLLHSPRALRPQCRSCHLGMGFSGHLRKGIKPW